MFGTQIEFINRIETFDLCRFAIVVSALMNGSGSLKELSQWLQFEMQITFDKLRRLIHEAIIYVP